MNNHAPAFQFYPADYLADAKVQALSIEGEGCYIRLLCYCWREGFLPNDRQALARLCKGYDGPGLDEAILCFSISKNKRRLTHKRLASELEKQEKWRKALSDGGLRGAESRWAGHKKVNGQAKQRPMAKNASSSSSSSSDNPPIVPPRRGRKYFSKHIGENRGPKKSASYWIEVRRLKAEGKTAEEISWAMAKWEKKEKKDG